MATTEQSDKNSEMLQLEAIIMITWLALKNYAKKILQHFCIELLTFDEVTTYFFNNTFGLALKRPSQSHIYVPQL